MLLDAKTTRSGIFGETALQLAGYRYADVWVIDDEEIEPPVFEYTGAIHIRADGYDLVPVEAGELQHKQFLYAMKVGEFADGARDLIGPAILPPTTSTFRLLREPQ